MADVEKKNQAKEQIFVPLGSTKDEETVFIAVNGKTMLIPRGGSVSVPKEFAEEWNRSQQAKADYAKKRIRESYKEQGANDPLKK